MSQAPHPLREQIIAHFYSGGRPKNLDGFLPGQASRLACRYGFKLQYVTDKEWAEILKARKERKQIK